jgi:putative addiction module component (TIGR02574 family)
MIRHERRVLEMSARSTELLDEVLTLPPQERVELAERILDSLSPESARAIEQMCADEAEARLDAYERGEIEALSGEEAIAWLNEQATR